MSLSASLVSSQNKTVLSKVRSRRRVSSGEEGRPASDSRGKRGVHVLGAGGGRAGERERPSRNGIAGGGRVSSRTVKLDEEPETASGEEVIFPTAAAKNERRREGERPPRATAAPADCEEA